MRGSTRLALAVQDGHLKSFKSYLKAANQYKLRWLEARRIVAILDGRRWADAFSVATLPEALKLQGCF